MELQAQKPLPSGQGLFDFQAASLLDGLREKKDPPLAKRERVLYLGCGIFRNASPQGESILVELQAQTPLPKATGFFMTG